MIQRKKLFILKKRERKFYLDIKCKRRRGNEKIETEEMRKIDQKNVVIENRQNKLKLMYFLAYYSLAESVQLNHWNEFCIFFFVYLKCPL